MGWKFIALSTLALEKWYKQHILGLGEPNNGAVYVTKSFIVSIHWNSWSLFLPSRLVTAKVFIICCICAVDHCSPWPAMTLWKLEISWKKGQQMVTLQGKAEGMSIFYFRSSKSELQTLKTQQIGCVVAKVCFTFSIASLTFVQPY